LREHLPLPVDVLAADAELIGQILGQFEFEAGELIIRPLKDVGPAAAGVAAPAQRPALGDVVERISRCARDER
jgi:hypothetical protein